MYSDVEFLVKHAGLASFCLHASRNTELTTIRQPPWPFLIVEKSLLSEISIHWSCMFFLGPCRPSPLLPGTISCKEIFEFQDHLPFNTQRIVMEQVSFL